MASANQSNLSLVILNLCRSNVRRNRICKSLVAARGTRLNGFQRRTAAVRDQASKHYDFGNVILTRQTLISPVLASAWAAGSGRSCQTVRAGTMPLLCQVTQCSG